MPVNQFIMDGKMPTKIGVFVFPHVHLIIAEIFICTEGAGRVNALYDFITFFMLVIFRAEIEKIEAAFIHIQQFIGMNISYINKLAEGIQQLLPFVSVLAHHAGTP